MFLFINIGYLLAGIFIILGIALAVGFVVFIWGLVEVAICERNSLTCKESRAMDYREIAKIYSRSVALHNYERVGDGKDATIISCPYCHCDIDGLKHCEAGRCDNCRLEIFVAGNSLKFSDSKVSRTLRSEMRKKFEVFSCDGDQEYGMLRP